MSAATLRSLFRPAVRLHSERLFHPTARPTYFSRSAPPPRGPWPCRNASTKTHPTPSPNARTPPRTRAEVHAARNRALLMYTSAVIIAAVGASYAAVPLYRMFCAATGFAGTPKVGTGRFEPERLVPVENARRIKVHFNADRSEQLPWKFTPQQKFVSVLPGESSLAFYTAKNTSDRDIIGIATYNVTPDRVAPYFSKVECFCFEEQRLLAGEEVDMPLLFFIDKDMLDDPACRNVEDVVLSYTFFKARRNERVRFDMSGGKRGGFMISTRRQGDVEDWREVVTFFTYPSRDRKYSEWPDKPEGWIKTTEEFSEKLMDLASKILEVLSEAMDMEKGALKKACGELNQKILTNFYPKCSNTDLELGLPRHTDPGTITILLQDQVGGLQATKDGAKTWINIPPMEGAFVINIGDHGHYLSNGRFRSADHRALANPKSDRLSIATFQYPTPEAIVYPLKVGEGEKAVIEDPISFAEMYKKKMSNEPVLAMFNHKGQNKLNPST